VVYRFSLTFPLLVTLSLAGCSSYTPTEPAPAPVEKKPDYTEVKPRQPEPSTTAAYQPLLDKAEQARQRGDYEQALALLERAQRIDADSADVYLAMARVLRSKAFDDTRSNGAQCAPYGYSDMR
jgi:Tfp pilus assembly protein PilF